jgi:hypothetical protein
MLETPSRTSRSTWSSACRARLGSSRYAGVREAASACQPNINGVGASASVIKNRRPMSMSAAVLRLRLGTSCEGEGKAGLGLGFFANMNGVISEKSEHSA